MSTISIPAPKPRTYLPVDFAVTDWETLQPFYEELANRTLESADDLRKWIADRDELDAVVSEEFAWRYIRISVDTADKDAAQKYQYYVQEISPKAAPYEDAFNKKLTASPFCDQLDSDTYFIYLRGVRKELELYREENIPLFTKSQMKSKEHGEYFSKMMVEVDGKQLTLQQAGTILEEKDREKREAVYRQISERILQDKDALEGVFDDLRDIRSEIARNADFDNYRDYKFQEMGRFDYEVQDCFDFHDSIASEIVPVEGQLNRLRKEKLGFESLRPWDLSVDMGGKKPLRPFDTVDGLIEKSIQTLSSLHPLFGETLAIMREMKHLDLDSREGKRPGGYNMPLMVSGVPFIFMNAAQSIRDLRTLMHEAGHAVHSLVTKDLPLNASKHFPSEVAELASMTTELITMDYWDAFFDNEEDLRRAKINQLEGVLKTLPWVATIDQFQHWLYTNPTHTREERKTAWLEISGRFSSKEVNREGLEAFAEYTWHRQLHIFEVPFYYIEYGMAQLGAIAIWKRYRENQEAAMKDFIRALSLGYTQPIGDLYKAAGIEFNFSREYVAELAGFVQQELEKLF